MTDLLSVRPKQSLSMQTRSGIRLDADVYYPAGEGPWPVLLMRQPYGREIASTVVYAHPRWYAAHGYIVVIQDVRGRGSSEGSFSLFAHEVEDGYDSVQWAAALPDSSGRVGMYGFSYQGMTQLYAAQAKPAALVALAPAMVGYDLYHDWAYENGALRLQAGLGWALQLAAETARLKGDGEAFYALRTAASALPVSGPVAARPDVLTHHGPDSFWHDWLDHPQPDDYWRSLSPDLTDVDLPMLHIGGWFDPYLTGDLRLYREMSGRSQYPQPLRVGPWGHIPWHHQVGQVDFGEEAQSPIDRLQIDWFDRWLQDKKSPEQPPVQLFEMGSNGWRLLDSLPQRPPLQQYWLRSSGLAGMRSDDGELLPSVPVSAAADTLVHDPWRPVPTLGGHGGLPGGMCDRTALEGRSDILTYTTPLLETPLAVTGVVEVSLDIDTEAPSYDVCAVLSMVKSDGRVFNLTQGYCRVAETSQTPISLTLQPTCFRLQPGAALRLSLSAACFPAYTVNPGTGSPTPDLVPALEHRIITLSVSQGDSTYVVLPLA